MDQLVKSHYAILSPWPMSFRLMTLGPVCWRCDVRKKRESVRLHMKISRGSVSSVFSVFWVSKRHQEKVVKTKIILLVKYSHFYPFFSVLDQPVFFLNFLQQNDRSNKKNEPVHQWILIHLDSHSGDVATRRQNRRTLCSRFAVVRGREVIMTFMFLRTWNTFGLCVYR